MTKRFSNNLDIEALLASKYAKKTDKFDKYVEGLLNTYIKEKELPVDFNNSTSLDDLLCGFYSSVCKNDGEFYAISTFHGFRHAINRLMKNRYNKDLTNDKEFLRSTNVFEAMTKEIKRKGGGETKHFPVISKEDLKLISEWQWKTPCELQWIAWFTIHFHTAMRGRENLHDLKKEDVMLSEVDGLQCIRIKDKATKNHQNDAAPSYGGVIFSTEYRCPVNLIKLYISKLHEENDYLWQKPMVLKSENDKWFANQKVGINTVGNFMKNLSQRIGLSTTYTNHSVRTTAITELGTAFQENDIASFSGHKSLSGLGIYKRVSNECKKNMSNKLHASISTTSPSKNIEEQHEKTSFMSKESSSFSLTDTPLVNFIDVEDAQIKSPTHHYECCISAGASTSWTNDDDEFSAMLNQPEIRAIIDGTSESRSVPTSSGPGGIAINYKCNVRMDFHIHQK